MLPWLREKLERSGVRFKRVQVDSLGDLRCMGHEILVNCSGCGARFLADVKDDQMKLVRGQTVLVKTSYDKVFIRRGITDYTYALGRGDGTAILGGIKNWGSADTRIDPGTRADACIHDPSRKDSRLLTISSRSSDVLMKTSRTFFQEILTIMRSSVILWAFDRREREMFVLRKRKSVGRKSFMHTVSTETTIRALFLT